VRLDWIHFMRGGFECPYPAGVPAGGYLDVDPRVRHVRASGLEGIRPGDVHGLNRLHGRFPGARGPNLRVPEPETARPGGVHGVCRLHGRFPGARGPNVGASEPETARPVTCME
jgi:hypothetical protein